MRDLLIGLARELRMAVVSHDQISAARFTRTDAGRADARFDIELVAERRVRDYLIAYRHCSLALYTECGSLEAFGANPEFVLMVDLAHGTRPTPGGLGTATVSIAAARIGTGTPCIRNVEAALLLEIKSGALLYADTELEKLYAAGYTHAVPRLSQNTEPSQMFWSVELNGPGLERTAAACSSLVEASARAGGVFVFNNPAFSISRIITGQLDAYVDFGDRVRTGEKKATAAFPDHRSEELLRPLLSDIAASVFLAQKSGAVVTDIRGRSLADTPLLELSKRVPRSCIAAANSTLHRRVLEGLRWEGSEPAP